jgi:hypothetical protein
LAPISSHVLGTEIIFWVSLDQGSLRAKDSTQSLDIVVQNSLRSIICEKSEIIVYLWERILLDVGKSTMINIISVRDLKRGFCIIISFIIFLFYCNLKEQLGEWKNENHASSNIHLWLCVPNIHSAFPTAYKCSAYMSN